MLLSLLIKVCMQKAGLTPRHAPTTWLASYLGLQPRYSNLANAAVLTK